MRLAVGKYRESSDAPSGQVDAGDGVGGCAPATTSLFLEDQASREDHRYRRAHFDHLFDASDPPEELGLEWAGVGGHVGVAVLGEARSEGWPGKKSVLENILVWLVEVVQRRSCSLAEACLHQGCQESDMHPCPLEDRRNLESK